MKQVELANMTWKAAAAARDRGAVVLVPVGTQEQNGSVSPLASDTLLVVEVARRVAHEADALLAPALNYGYCPALRGFPGTISLRPDTLRMLIEDVCGDLIETGFEHVLLVCSHTSNLPIMEHAARQIRSRLGVTMGYFNPIALAEAATKDLYAGREASLGHGSEPIASMLRSFSPEVVHLEASEAGVWKQFQGLTVSGSTGVKLGNNLFGLYYEQTDVTENGGTGDPGVSDPARGAEAMRRVVALATDYVRVFARLNVRSTK